MSGNLTPSERIESSLETIRTVLLNLDGASGAAQRSLVGLASTQEEDQQFLAGVTPGQRTGLLMAAKAELIRELDGVIAPELIELVSRASAVTGQPLDSEAVSDAVANHVHGIDPTELRALIRGFNASRTARSTEWAAYKLWNRALVFEFFGGSRAGRPVYLDLEPELLLRLATEIGAPAEIIPTDPQLAFCRSVARTFELRSPGPEMLHRHAMAARLWAEGTSSHGGLPGFDFDPDVPPFLAPLGLFSLAAEHMHAGEGMAQTNYYGRLCELLEVQDASAQKKVENDFRRDSNALWGHLNSWLQRAHGARGLPTAEAFNHLAYVGVPISQALVRAADRDKLPEFFLSYELNPGQQFSRIDMREIFGSWLPHSPLGGPLKSLWSSGQEARRRISDVVCLELEHWDGNATPSESDSGREFRASLAATWDEAPVPEFSAMLAVRDAGDVPVGRYELTDEAGPPGGSGPVAATRDYGGLVKLEFDGHEEPGRLVRLALRESLEFVSDLQKTTIARPRRDIIVLLWDEARWLFIESAHTELGRDHLLLVRNELAPDVDRALEDAARAGFGTVSNTAGVPEGWTLFTRVHIRALLTALGEPLMALLPQSKTQVDLTGGMQLSAARWHSTAPPTIVAVDGVERRFVVTLFDESGIAGETPPLELGSYTGEALIPLEDRQLADGNYRVILNEVTSTGRVGAHLTSRPLKLRSGASAHLDPPTSFKLAHHGSPGFDGWGALSATDLEASGGTVLQGATRAGTTVSPLPAPRTTLPTKLGQSAVASLDDLFGRLPATERSILEGQFENLLRQGLVSLDGPRPRLTAAGWAWVNENLGASVTARPGADPETAAPIGGGFEADLDLILDALVVVAGGSWNSLDRLIRYSSVERWEPVEAARNLSALGYVDLELDRHSLKIARWSAAPATLAVQPDGMSAFVTGSRSEELLEQVERETTARGGVAYRHASSGRPVLLQVHGLAGRGFDELAKSAGLACTRDGATRIAELLPSIRAVYRQRPELYVPQGSTLERFDFDSNGWKSVTQIQLAGAYRITAETMHYGILAADGLRECDNSVAKYAAAAAAGRDIMAYDPASSKLTCLLGARPPGLYERAIVLCTGELPRTFSNNTSVYDGVTAEVAAWLADRLGPHGWEDD